MQGLQQKPGPPIFKLTPEQARAGLSSMQAGPVQKLPADIENRTITGPNGELFLHIIRPVGSSNQTLPIVMYFHGDGWVLGGADTHDRLLRELVNKANTTIVFVNYTRSPEAKYPIPLEEAYAATKWVAENGEVINVDPSRLAVAGDSVGGNMATVVVLLANERGGPEITYQALFYPVTDANFNTTSYLKYREGYHLTGNAMKWFWENYAPDNATQKQPHASPLQASVEQLRGYRQHL